MQLLKKNKALFITLGILLPIAWFKIEHVENMILVHGIAAFWVIYALLPDKKAKQDDENTNN